MNVTVMPVKYGESRYSETANLARTCSFQGTGQYLSELMTDQAFCDFERIFAAVVDDTVVGFCAVVKESCCENDRNTPWLDFVFVDETCRNLGIARQMIAEAEKYARSIGFPSLFLCTASHEAFYRKCGFVTVYDAKINENTTGKVMKTLL